MVDSYQNLTIIVLCLTIIVLGISSIVKTIGRKHDEKR